MNIKEALIWMSSKGVEITPNVFDVFSFSEEDGKELKNKINQSYQKYTTETPSESSISSLDRTLERNSRVLARSTFLSGSTYLGLLDLQDRFRFERIPALQAAAQTGSQFTSAVAQGIQAQEEYVLNLTSNISQGITGGILASNLALSTIGAVRSAQRSAAYANEVKNVTSTLRSIRRGLRVGRLARLNPIALVFGIAAEGALSYFINRLVEPTVRFFKRDQIDEIMETSLLSSIIDAGSVGDYYRATRFIPNYNFEDLRNLQQRTSMYGARLPDLYSALEVVSKEINISENYVNDYASQILNTANFFGVNQESISRSFINLARIGAGEPDTRELQPVAREFERFFLAVGQAVNPAISKLELVNQLSDFAYSYAFNQKLVTDLSGLAQIQDFISRTELGELQTTQTTQNLIVGLDDVLRGYANFTNSQATVFGQSANISRAEASQGLTSNPEILTKILSYLQTRFDISSEISDDKFGQVMFYLTNPSRGLGMSNAGAQSVLVLLREYVKGKRIKEIQVKEAFNIPYVDEQGRLQNVTPLDGDGVISYNERQFLDVMSKPLEVLSSVADDNFRLLSENMEHFETVLEITLETQQAFVEKTMSVLGSFSDLAELGVEIVRKIYGGKEKVTSPSTQNVVGATDVILPDTRNRRNLQPEIFVGGNQKQLPVPTPEIDESNQYLIPTPNVSPIERNNQLPQGTPEEATQNILSAIYQQDVANNFITNYFREGHQGFDADLGHETPLYSPISGVVVDVGNKSDLGNFIRIEDSLGMIHTFAHFSDKNKPELNYSVGDKVSAGSLLGLQGATGKVYSVNPGRPNAGSHLHYDVRFNRNPNSRINPVAAFEALESYEEATGDNVIVDDYYSESAYSTRVTLDYLGADAEKFAENFVEMYNNYRNQNRNNSR